MTHIHLCGYDKLIAKYALLSAADRLEPGQLEAADARGHRKGDMLTEMLCELHDADAPAAHPMLGVMVVRADTEANGICVFSHEALQQEVPECYRIVTPDEEAKQFTAWLERRGIVTEPPA